MSQRNPEPIENLKLPLKPESLECLHRFLQYKRKEIPFPIPRSRTAAVAIILFVGRKGDLYVILSTRAGELRTYANDTALPGGKYEEGDEDEEGTAVGWGGSRPQLRRFPKADIQRREAYEEVGLPMDKERVRCLCLLDPFLAGNQLLVTPVVFLAVDRSINPVLNPSEVKYLFSMPLSSFLYDRPQDIPGWNFGFSERLRERTAITPLPDDLGFPGLPHYAETDDEKAGVGGKEGHYYQYRDITWGPGTVRMHRFLTGREGGGVKPVYGLTAGMLIHAAMVGFGRDPAFQLNAPGQVTVEQRVLFETLHRGGPLRRAIEKEGNLGVFEAAEKDKAKL